MSSQAQVWHIEYTNHPPIRKQRRKILERAVTEFIDEIEGLLQVRANDGVMLGETGFYIESTWLKDLEKYHIAVRDSKSGDRWVASITFKDYPTMNVNEVKDTLRRLGFNEYSLYALGATNEKTVGQMLAELESNFKKEDRQELLREIDYIAMKFLMEFLKQGVIKSTDGLLDAFRKIDKIIESF